MNHRLALYDMVLIKDNHVDAAGGILPAVERARAAHPELPIEVEVRTLDELRQALGIEPPLDRILLDNMSLEQMRQAVALTAGRVPAGSLRRRHPGARRRDRRHRRGLSLGRGADPLGRKRWT